MGRQFATDCEGPLSKNDNAYELSAHFVPEGESFFATLSKYDDFLADVVRKKGYRAGDTLKLILPFLIAFGADNAAIREYCRSHILLVPGAAQGLRSIRRFMPCFIISTSYGPYIHALCDLIDFPMDHAFSTEIDIDAYDLDPEEGAWLRKAATEIAAMELPHWPRDRQRAGDVLENHRKTLSRLDDIFWRIIPGMKIGRIFHEVHPMGGDEKARALLKSLERTGCRLEDVMYVGDSITDVQALELVRAHGGLSVSFNGNGYAVRSAHVCCMSSDARAVAVLAEVFNEVGRDGALEVVRSWRRGEIVRFPMDSALRDWIDALPERDFPRMEPVLDTNRSDLIRKSESFRRSVRGEKVGALG